jgi:predicted hotdog family 3-hydroxylacyl-ACP dehydratase
MNARVLLPQSGVMALIDEVASVERGKIMCKMLVKECVFTENGVLPNYVFMEIMAQSIAAYASSEGDVNMGFLLSVRKMRFERDFVRVGEELEILANESLSDGAGMFVFDCEIRLKGETIASASLSVLNPSEEFLREAMNE